jgi:plastocyanin
VWFGAMMLWMVAFWVGVVVLGVWLASLLFPRVPTTSQPAPREILDDRRDGRRMHGLAIVGGALILLALLSMGAFAGWGMHGPWSGPGPSWMPHMGWGWRPNVSTVPAPGPIAGAKEVAVALVDFGFRPAEIRIRVGQSVNLELANRGGVVHDLTIPALGFQAAVQPGRQSTAGLRAPAAGTYEYYCSVPGHREAGMGGRLVVTP